MLREMLNAAGSKQGRDALQEIRQQMEDAYLDFDAALGDLHRDVSGYAIDPLASSVRLKALADIGKYAEINRFEERYRERDGQAKNILSNWDAYSEREKTKAFQDIRGFAEGIRTESEELKTRAGQFARIAESPDRPKIKP